MCVAACGLRNRRRTCDARRGNVVCLLHEVVEPRLSSQIYRVLERDQLAFEMYVNLVRALWDVKLLLSCFERS